MVFEAPGRSNVHVWKFSGCRVKKPPKFNEKTHSEREKERNWWRKTEKKGEILGGPGEERSRGAVRERAGPGRAGPGQGLSCGGCPGEGLS